MFGFINITITDILDIFLVAVLIYQVYNLMKNSAASRIFLAVVALYLVWVLARALKMEMLSTVLGQMLGVGVIAGFIVFQPEIRRFLLYLSIRYFDTNGWHGVFWRTIFHIKKSSLPVDVDELVIACRNMSERNTGALILITRKSPLDVYAETGDIVDAQLSSRLLENIFFKNSPLHDGALIIDNNRIKAARCTLPITENPRLPASYGMRHRAALGASEHTDALVVIVSEETGKISIAEHGIITPLTGSSELRTKLVELGAKG